ncbi:hypothetical protein [Flavobacterium sp.]|uniref:hypothetical protein n=1 Tax=Flavobacterium sp. TaxID=239 RepID=UPI00121B16DD|nr:hypothetical protein [Flavobacterium sp.]RZJ71288.1 MAG: hypothetical protein EOO49_11105 [Flavobacterium sp.]
MKQAADNAETKEFPSLEQVWSRVEHKLDNKVLVKQNKKWKQWAVAASVVAVVSLGYQVVKTESEPIAVPVNQPVFEQKTQPELKPQSDIAPIPNEAVRTSDNAQIEEVARPSEDPSGISSREDEIHVSQSGSFETVAKTEEKAVSAPNMSPVASKIKETSGYLDERSNDDSDYDLDKRRAKGVMAKGRVFDAEIVTSAEADNKSAKAQKSDAKQKPLLIVDGKPLVGKNDKDYDRKLEEVMGSVPTERDTIFYLKEPLYIIDGKEYTEESLFGPNPTSPYAPLNLQEEGMKTRIYTGKEALKQFGEKGKNGVIIVTTKNGKPANKKSKK